MSRLQRLVLAVFDLLVLLGFQLFYAWSIGVKNYCDFSPFTDCFALTSFSLMGLSAVYAFIYVFLCHKGFALVMTFKIVALLVCILVVNLSL